MILPQARLIRVRLCSLPSTAQNPLALPLHQYESYGSKLTFMQAFMQLDHLHELDLIELLPSRDKLEHFCLHDLLHLMLEELIMTELVAIGQDRGYFIISISEQEDDISVSPQPGPRHH